MRADVLVREIALLEDSKTLLLLLPDELVRAPTKPQTRTIRNNSVKLMTARATLMK
jgi:hypothetical protein